jgi:hypothetical protein
VIAIAAGSYFCANTYADHQLDIRASRYRAQANTAESKEIMDKTAGPVKKIQYLQQISSQEETFDQRIPEFLKYLKKVRPQLEQLTTSAEERYGSIEYDNGMFKITTDDEWFIKIRSEFGELARGDLTHQQEILDCIEKYPELLDAKERQLVPVMLSILETKKRYDLLSPEERPRVRMGLVNPDGTTEPWDYERVSKAATGAQQVFALIQKQLSLTSPQIVDNISPKWYARFHTHPKDDPNYSPSPADVANTQLLGPTTLFSQKDGMLHIYAINRGRTREIYAVKLGAENR